jgi:uncharacterized protein YkwD
MGVALLLGALAAGCAAEDLQVVTGPDPDEVTPPPTGVVIDDPADEQGSENGTGGGTTNALEETTSSSSSTTTSSTTVPPETTSTTEPPTSSTAPPPPDESGPGVVASAAVQSVAFVNDRRAENGVGGLRSNPELQALAEAWAQQMADDQDMRHNPNLNEQMPDGYWAWGENVAYGFDGAAINQAWWDSEGHRANMLNGDYTAIGVGFVRDGSGDLWAVQVFGGAG